MCHNLIIVWFAYIIQLLLPLCHNTVQFRGEVEILIEVKQAYRLTPRGENEGRLHTFGVRAGIAFGRTGEVYELWMPIIHLNEVGVLVHDLPDVTVLLLVVVEQVLDGDLREAQQLDKLIFFRFEILLQIEVQQPLPIRLLFFNLLFLRTLTSCLIPSRAFDESIFFLLCLDSVLLAIECSDTLSTPVKFWSVLSLSISFSIVFTF